MEKKTKTVSVVGGGIGGLASAILLAKQGHKVSVYEKNECLGGRASILHKDGYTFDMGPSRYLMPDVFEEFFELIGEDINDWLDLKQLSPSYKVFYNPQPPTPSPSERGRLSHLDIYADPQRMATIFESLEAGAGKQLLKYLDRSKEQYNIGMEFCKKNYDTIFDFFRWDIMRKGIKLNIRTTIDKYVARFFHSQIIRKIMQYTTVFLGTPPRQTPALYNIMSYADFGMGVRYPKGGIHQVAQALYQIGLKNGVEYHLHSEIIGCEIDEELKQIKKLNIKTLKQILIVNNNSKHIDELKSLLEQRGYQCTIIQANEITKINANDFDCIILSGGSHIRSVMSHPKDYAREMEFVKTCSKPIIGICLGAQIIAYAFGSTLGELEQKQDGLIDVDFNGAHKKLSVIEHHRYAIQKLGSELESIAHSDDGIEVFGHKDKKIIGLQFHPECDINKQDGDEFFKDILDEMIGCEKENNQIESLKIKQSGYIIHIIGKVGSGKSTTAKLFSEKLGLKLIQTDIIHKSIINNPKYTNDELKIVDEHIDEIIVTKLLSKESFILEGYGTKESGREKIKTLAQKYGFDYIQVAIIIDNEDEIKYRLDKRHANPNRDSDGNYDVYLKLKDMRSEQKTGDGFQIYNNGSFEDLELDVDNFINNELKHKTTNSNNINSDLYLINADMAWFETSVLPSDYQTYTKSYRDKKIFAPSGFIIYAGINKKLPKLDHHNLYFCEDRNKNFGQIFDSKILPDDPSIYVSKITHTDPSMAPDGCENLFILVPIPNGISISDNQKTEYKNRIRELVEKMAGENIVDHIQVEKIFSVDDFESRYHARKGTALGLAHNLMQTAVFRPNNISKKLDNLFYVGHNTNPGIGVPMVLISAQLAIQRITKYLSKDR